MDEKLKEALMNAVEERIASLEKDKKEFETALENSRLYNNERNGFAQDLEKVNKELEIVQKEKEEILGLDEERKKLKQGVKDSRIESLLKDQKQLEEELSKGNLRNYERQSLENDLAKVNKELEVARADSTIKLLPKTVAERLDEIDAKMDEYLKQYNIDKEKIGQDKDTTKDDDSTVKDEQDSKNANSDSKTDKKQEEIQKRSEKFVNLSDKYQQNQKDLDKIIKEAEQSQDNPDKLTTLDVMQKNLEKENKELKKQLDEMNKYKIVVDKKNEIEEYENKKDKVVFNIRTGLYTYFDKNNEGIDIKLDEKYLTKEGKKESIKEIMEKTGLTKKQANKVDINLYQILKQMDKRNNTTKADDYLKAFENKDKKKMPVDLTYDLRNKNSNKEKENSENKLSFMQKLKMKVIAKQHEAREIATVWRDRSLFRKFLLGLGIAGVAGTLAIGNTQSTQPINETGIEQENEKDNENEKDSQDEAKDEVKDEENNKTEEELLEDLMKGFEESDFVSVNAGQEYIEASDLTQTGRRGQFVEDMDCQITNRAIVEIMEDGSERIVATSKGKTWEEAGINLDDYKSGNYVEKYALEAIDGRTDSRGYSRFGWVNSDNCEKLYSRVENINGEETITYHSMDDIKAMVKDKMEQNKTAHQSFTDSIRTSVAGLSEQQIANANSNQRVNDNDREM